MSYPSLEISKNKLKVIVRLTKILLLEGNIHKVQSKALYVGNELSQKSFTDNFTDTVTVEEDRTDVVNITRTRGENEKEIPRVRSFELTQSVV